jgi:hypothetical protein
MSTFAAAVSTPGKRPWIILRAASRTSTEVCLARSSLVGPWRGNSVIASTTAGCPRIILATSNGTGMGHIARLVATAMALRGRAEPIFFSMSLAMPAVLESSGCAAIRPVITAR